MSVVEEELTEAVLDEVAAEASRDAIENLQRLSIDIVYMENGLHVLEQPDGSRFQIEYTQEHLGAYKILNSLPKLS